MRKLKIFFVVFAAIAVMFTVTDAFARRGGSFGFRGGFRGRSRGFSSRSYHPSRSYGSRGLGLRGFGCIPIFMPFGGGGLFSLLIFLAIGYFILKMMRKRQGGGGMLSGNEARGVVARLTMAFFATEKTLQKALVELARRQPPGTQEQAQAYMLRETALLLLRHMDAVAKVAFEQHPGMNMSQAQSMFEQLVMKMRSSFDQTGIRRDDAGLHEANTPDTARPASGVSEFVVVSMIVAYNEPASILKTVISVDDIRTALQNIASIGADRLLGMEVIWDPESPDGVLDQEGMVSSYPDLIDV